VAYVINGVLDVGEWKMAARLNSAGNSPSGYNIYGAVDGDAFVFALQSAVDIGFNTTLWLNTDHNTATGHPIFDWLNAGADFNITFVAGSTGAAPLHRRLPPPHGGRRAGLRRRHRRFRVLHGPEHGRVQGPVQRPGHLDRPGRHRRVRLRASSGRSQRRDAALVAGRHRECGGSGRTAASSCARARRSL